MHYCTVFFLFHWCEESKMQLLGVMQIIWALHGLNLKLLGYLLLRGLNTTFNAVNDLQYIIFLTLDLWKWNYFWTLPTLMNTKDWFSKVIAHVLLLGTLLMHTAYVVCFVCYRLDVLILISSVVMFTVNKIAFAKYIGNIGKTHCNAWLAIRPLDHFLYFEILTV